MSHLLGIGLATLDHLVRVEQFPAADTKVETGPLQVEGGGPAATAMVAAARLGEPARFVGTVGDDARGGEIRRGLESEGVEVEHLLVRPGSGSPFSFIFIEGAGRRTVLWTRGDAGGLRPEEIPPGLVEGAAALLVDGHQPAAQEAAARRARRAGT